MGTLANRVRMVSAYYRGEPDGIIWPQEVVVELTNHCNLACIMCPHGAMQRDKGFMDFDLFKSIIDQIKGRAELVYLYGTGESLLHKSFAEYIDYAAAAGLTTMLSTNGIPMTEANAVKLLQSRLDYLVIALDGGTRETYESIRIKGKFDLLLANIRTLLAKRRELGSTVRVQLQMIVMEENAHEIAQFKALFDEDEQRQLDQLRLKPIFKTYANPDGSIRHTRPCYWLWNMMSITWDGRVQLCCMDYDATGLSANMRDQPLSEIWNSAEINGLRRRHKALDYDSMPLCRGCDIPEQGYFNNATILASTLLNAGAVRRIMPAYEKLVLLKDWFSGRHKTA
ncbi:MAG: radical SAM protein [Phaeospirillum sp.]|nr:radical SAM protein [Phaeospirillum sp.]